MESNMDVNMFNQFIRKELIENYKEYYWFVEKDHNVIELGDFMHSRIVFRFIPEEHKYMTEIALNVRGEHKPSIENFYNADSEIGKSIDLLMDKIRTALLDNVITHTHKEEKIVKTSKLINHFMNEDL